MTRILKSVTFLALLILLTTFAKAQNSKAVILKQLSELQQAITTGDQNKVATFFDFPVQSDELKIRAEYADEKVINIPTFDKAAFTSHYSRVITFDITNLFKTIDLSELKTKNKIERKIIPDNKTETCSFTYAVELSGSNVTISLATNTRTDITLKAGDNCPEYFEKWDFKMKGSKLKFAGFSAAG